jgi:hypothetical protein
VHFELPWTPARLEQRTGRVDRFGQARRVHEIMLVARHTCERLVLAPLLKRARTAATCGGRAARVTSLTESTVAAAVMAGVDVVEEVPVRPVVVASIDIRAEAHATVRDLASARRLASAEGTGWSPAPAGVVVAASRRPACSSILVVVEVALARADGRPVHRELVPLAVECTTMQAPRQAAALARSAQALIASHSSAMCALAEQSCGTRLDAIAAACRKAARVATAREREIAAARPSAARRLVQISLFDRRGAKALDARRIANAEALLETDERVSDLSALSIRTTSRVVAIRFGWDVRP